MLSYLNCDSRDKGDRFTNRNALLIELLLTFVVVRKHGRFLDIYYNLLKFKFE